MKGQVIWFNAKKGIGFIKQENGQDLFVHFSDILMDGYKELKKNQFVSYEIGTNYSGKPKAIEVKIIS